MSYLALMVYIPIVLFFFYHKSIFMLWTWGLKGVLRQISKEAFETTESVLSCCAENGADLIQCSNLLDSLGPALVWKSCWNSESEQK